MVEIKRKSDHIQIIDPSIAKTKAYRCENCTQPTEISDDQQYLLCRHCGYKTPIRKARNVRSLATHAIQHTPVIVQHDTGEGSGRKPKSINNDRGSNPLAETIKHKGAWQLLDSEWHEPT